MTARAEWRTVNSLLVSYCASSCSPKLKAAIYRDRGAYDGIQDSLLITDGAARGADADCNIQAQGGAH